MCGCGYTFQGSGSVLPPEVKKIESPFVQNDSAEAGISTLLTESLRDQFDKYGVVTVVEDENEADAVLSVRIKEVKREAQSVTSKTDVARQYDTSMTLYTELKKRNGQILYRNPNMVISKGFGAESGAVVTTSPDFIGGNISGSDLSKLGGREVARGQEQSAFEAIADEASKQIYDAAVSPDF